MKAKAILFASVLLAGCQASSQYNAGVQQHAQSLSSADQDDAGMFSGRETSARWMGNGALFAQDKNLWNYISHQLKMGVPENSRIREQKKKYLSNKSYLHDVTLRAEPYMYWIARQVKQRNMPMEIVLLPIVESAFDPRATSSAHAAGIWQIIPSTGHNYGLKQTKVYDGRRDLVASTNAALDMLQRLNKMFKGDWLLTVAAYNSGERRVLNAIKANKSRGKPTDFWSLSLPQETKIYVPKMLALSEIFQNSQKYGVSLPEPNKDRALARVDVNNPVELSQIAEITGMSLTKLKTFNAGVKSATIGKNNPRYVLVPRKHAEKLRASLAAGHTTTAKPTLLADNNIDQHDSKSYTVRSGDTLSSIASRLGVNTRDLQTWNHLRGSNLKVGQTLSVSNSHGRLANNG